MRRNDWLCVGDSVSTNSNQVLSSGRDLITAAKSSASSTSVRDCSPSTPLVVQLIAKPRGGLFPRCRSEPISQAAVRSAQRSQEGTEFATPRRSNAPKVTLSWAGAAGSAITCVCRPHFTSDHHTPGSTTAKGFGCGRNRSSTIASSLATAGCKAFCKRQAHRNSPAEENGSRKKPSRLRRAAPWVELTRGAGAGGEKSCVGPVTDRQFSARVRTHVFFRHMRYRGHGTRPNSKSNRSVTNLMRRNTIALSSCKVSCHPLGLTTNILCSRVETKYSMSLALSGHKVHKVASRRDLGEIKSQVLAARERSFGQCVLPAIYTYAMRDISNSSPGAQSQVIARDRSLSYEEDYSIQSSQCNRQKVTNMISW